jgi:hypothetical protein
MQTVAWKTEFEESQQKVWVHMRLTVVTKGCLMLDGKWTFLPSYILYQMIVEIWKGIKFWKELNICTA